VKGIISIIAAVMQDGRSRANLKALLRLLLFLCGMIIAYSIIFHFLMAHEGQEHTWITGFYWTLTVMTTLGFGDITFASDAGRLFSIIVMVTGVLFLLVLLPFSFIEFFYAPWMRAQAAARTPRELPPATKQHVIITRYDAVSTALIPMLEKYGYSYVIVCPTISEALELEERGLRVAVGERNDPETYRKLRIENAAMVFTSLSDEINTGVTFTAREVAPHLPIVSTALSVTASDVLTLAGASMIMRLEEIMGRALARRIVIRDSDAHVIGSLQGLQLAEASAAGTQLVGLALKDSKIRALTGVSVVGYWDQGKLKIANRDYLITDDSLLVLAGTKEQLDAYNREFSSTSNAEPKVLIIGGGKVGRAAYHALKDMGVQWIKLIEKNQSRITDHSPDVIIGDATDIHVLKRAQAREATSLMITSHDDDTNVALTIFFRKLHKSWQILTRSTLDRNVQMLQRAGADLVLSYASMGSNMILNELRGADHLLLAEGINVFPVEIPASMARQTISSLHIRSQTGCSIIAVEFPDGSREINPMPDMQLPAQGKIFLIGSLEAEEQFFQRFSPYTKGASQNR
jgi:voltage-gated potassium channel